MRSDPRHHEHLFPGLVDRRASTVKALARHFIGLVVVGIAIGLACWPLNVVDRLQSLLFAWLPTTATTWSWPGAGIALLPVVVMPTPIGLVRTTPASRGNSL